MSRTDPSPPWYLGTANRLFTAAITGLIAAAGAYAAASGREDRALNVFLAAFMGSVSLMALTTRPPREARWSTADLAGRPAWKLSLGPAQPVPAVALVVTSLGLGLAWAAVANASGLPRGGVGGDGGDGGDGGGIFVAVLCGLLAAFLLVVAVTTWQAWARPPAFLVSADHLRYAGVGAVVDLDWDDVGTVEHVDRTSRWACLKVIARVGAPSYSHRKRWTLLPTDRTPDPAGLELRHTLLADQLQLTRLLRELHAGERAFRESLISLGLPQASGR